MTFDKLYKVHESTVEPTVMLYPHKSMYGVFFLGDTIYLTETEAALLCGRLLAILPARTASAAIALSELIRRDKSE